MYIVTVNEGGGDTQIFPEDLRAYKYKLEKGFKNYENCLYLMGALRRWIEDVSTSFPKSLFIEIV